MASKKEKTPAEEIELSEKVEHEKESEKEIKVDNSPSKEELEAKIKELEALLQEKENSHLRMAAEYENFRRRSREEREATYTEAVADTVGEILPIIDNLERASMYDDDAKVKEGLVMIAKSVSAAFSALGVEEVGAVGDSFDPNLHSAVMHVEDESFGENEIAEVFQKGYKKGDKVIRYAMVKVAN